jgi:hypothetical protein
VTRRQREEDLTTFAVPERICPDESTTSARIGA